MWAVFVVVGLAILCVVGCLAAALGVAVDIGADHLDRCELYADTIQKLQDQLCEANDSADFWKAQCDNLKGYKGEG